MCLSFSEVLPLRKCSTPEKTTTASWTGIFPRNKQVTSSCKALPPAGAPRQLWKALYYVWKGWTLTQGKHFWWDNGYQKICLLCHQSQKRAKCLTNLLMSGRWRTTQWYKTTGSSRTVDKIWLVAKGEHEGAMVCFAKVAALTDGTWIGIALEDVKLLLILPAKLWNQVGTAIYHIL